MADDKKGRNKQARDADRRQRERDIAAQRERGDEPEPPMDTELDELESELSRLDFPATGADVIAAVGNQELEADSETYSIETLVPDTAEEEFDSPAAVRQRIQRPTVARAMKRIVEAIDQVPNAELRRSQRDAYEKTLLALKAVDADDDDEGIQVITDWIVERIREKNALPGSRAVRRRAAKFCRSNGYPIRNDEWLGV